MNSVWIIDEDSRNYSWKVCAESKEKALEIFKEQWWCWCKNTGAEPDLWGNDFEEVQTTEVEVNSAHIDHWGEPGLS